MGRSRSSTTSQAASSSRISSFCPTQRTGSSSGWARCRATLSTTATRSWVMRGQHNPAAARWRRPIGGNFRAMSLPVVEEVGPATDCRRSLEEGRILLFPSVSLALPPEDVAFLLSQRQSGARYHKNIAYRPAQARISGVAGGEGADAERLRGVLAEYSRRAVKFTAGVLPDYARAS